MSIDDKHSDHDLKTYLDGRDGVSAAYRQSAQEEPPASLDRMILAAARKAEPPAPAGWLATRKPYALAASVMLAVLALSLYVGGLEDVVQAPESAVLRQEATQAEGQPAERAEALPDTAEDASAVAIAPQQPAAGPPFATRQLAPPVPTVGNGTAGAVPPATAPLASEAFARRAEPAAVVIDGPLLEEIESEAEAARELANTAEPTQLEEISVTGSRIVRREEADLSYRQSRETWLEAMRAMRSEVERSARVTAAQRRTAVLESQLEDEIELFLAEYPDADIEAELDASPPE